MNQKQKLILHSLQAKAYKEIDKGNERDSCIEQVFRKGACFEMYTRTAGFPVLICYNLEHPAYAIYELKFISQG